MANLIFDYDGTIHESMKTYAPAFRTTCKWLSDNGYMPEKEYTDKEISYWLGFNSTDMWSNFLSDADINIREKARTMLGEDMAQRVENGEGALFPNTEQVLNELKNKGHTLIFLSNCRIKYMERHSKVFGLNRFFDYFYCCEQFDFIPKYQIFRLFSLQHKGQYIVIGDRFHDIETAVQNGLKSIGCGYGYATDGELKNADIIVNDITEIPYAVEKLIN
ncbi:MAG: HAD family hydrolase [Ruminococcus sp.]|nr:HAD family hydrolase [Ruminococcus sp.]MDE7104897.1 HAD family hydrolase [Ruminococcus sp.]